MRFFEIDICYFISFIDMLCRFYDDAIVISWLDRDEMRDVADALGFSGAKNVIISLASLR